MKKKLISVWIAAALAVSVTACGGPKPEPAAPAESAEESVSSEEAAESAEETAPDESGADGEQTAESAEEDSGAIAFETTDLEGNEVRFEDIYKENRLTMVNLWGTYCGPCIREMPDLEVLHERLKEKDCAIIGVVVDVDGAKDSERIEAAEEIIAQTGVTYPNLLPFRDIFFLFPAEFIPTTYFVDSNGRIVGEAAVGARGADEYEALIDALLKD